VANVLTGIPRVTLVCYYTAAMLLQRKYARQLGRTGLLKPSLPDLFGRELALPPSRDVDSLLEQLGKRQASLSGRPINWVGTYEHAAKHILRHFRELSH